MRNIYKFEYNSVYRGIIEDNKDPESLGRCKIRIPSVHGLLNYPVKILPWARPIVLTPVHAKKGSSNIPDIGDVVWVFFEGGNKEFPVYLGGTYATEDIELNPQIINFYIEDDTKISYDRVSKTYNIKLGDTMMTISAEGVSIQGNTVLKGSMSIEGDLSVSGTTYLTDLVISGSCNKECDCT